MVRYVYTQNEDRAKSKGVNISSGAEGGSVSEYFDSKFGWFDRRQYLWVTRKLRELMKQEMGMSNPFV